VKSLLCPTDKLPLVIFGDGMFGKKNLVHFGGHRHGVVDVLWRTLKQKKDIPGPGSRNNNRRILNITS
jgi:hypothetical protein